MSDQPYDRVWMVASPGGLLESELPWPLEYDEPQRVRVEDDLFDEAMIYKETAAVFAIMRECRHLTFQVLTDRSERMRDWLRWASMDPSFVATAAPGEWPLPNVRLGVTARTQKEWDDRVSHLVECPAAVRFVSCDPCLEEIEVGHYLIPHAAPGICISIDGDLWHEPGSCPYCRPAIDQLILGGDFGPGAKPCNVTAWPETIRQCRQAGVAVYVTHLGAKPFERTPVEMDWPGGFLVDDDDSRVWPILDDPKGGDPSEWPPELQVREFPEVKS